MSGRHFAIAYFLLSHFGVSSFKSHIYRQPTREIVNGNTIVPDEHRRNLFVATGTSFLTGALGVPKVSRALEESEIKRIQVFEQVSPSVVFIDTFREARDAFSTNVLEVPLGSGSGIIWSKEGYIVTNYHVVRNAQSASVAILQDASQVPENVLQQSQVTQATFTSMRPTTSPPLNGQVRAVYKARVVGVDPGKDIAVLKVDAPDSLLQPIPLGSSAGLRVGQQALAIGNPFGLDHTLTTGVISGLGREVKSPIGRPISNVIQTDAAVNPGNSGGPLLDSGGKMIGMNTAIYSPSGASAGIGFSIPVDTVKFIVDVLIRDGKVVRPVMGISYLESKQARALGITTGVLILDVPQGSPAALAGLKGTRRTESGLIEVGDIVVRVNDRTIVSESDLFAALEDKEPGDTVTVVVNRLIAKDDQLAVAEVAVDVKLQASTAFERNFFMEPMVAK